MFDMTAARYNFVRNGAHIVSLTHVAMVCALRFINVTRLDGLYRLSGMHTVSRLGTLRRLPEATMCEVLLREMVYILLI